jgi:ferredoxin--NADP+ reductase
MLDDQGELLPCNRLDYLEFYIVLVREAAAPPALTPRLFMLKEGSRLSVEKKIVGHYVMENIGPEDPVWFFATGTGEAPHNAMATQLLCQGHRGPIVMISCVRERADLGYLAVHQKLAKRYSNYRYLTYTTREPENLDKQHPQYVGKQYLQSELESGRMESVAGSELRAASSHVFLCGNPEMIGIVAPGGKPLSRPGMIQLLEQRGFRSEGDPGPGLIRYEKYW